MNSTDEIIFVESLNIKDGVVCDVYTYKNDSTKDLGIVKVSKGCKTPKQEILSGIKTLEIYKSGTGSLTIDRVDGSTEVHNFPGRNTDVEVKIGDVMQWNAVNDLVFHEICFPPYQDGRFKNL